MIVKIKLLDERAKLPNRAHYSDAGMDIVAVSRKITIDYFEYGTGISIAIPPNHAGFIFPRSSISKKNLNLCNAVGVIDSNFRGEIKIRFNENHHSNTLNVYEVGDKVVQLIILPYPEISFLEVDDLDKTDRGSGGFGHTDDKFGLKLEENITPITRYNLSEL